MKVFQIRQNFKSGPILAGAIYQPDLTKEVVGTCVTSWYFGENSVGRATAREEGKRKTKRNATELATGDKWRGHGLFTTQGAGTRADKMASMENVNLPVRQNTTAATCMQFFIIRDIEALSHAHLWSTLITNTKVTQPVQPVHTRTIHEWINWDIRTVTWLSLLTALPLNPATCLREEAIFVPAQVPVSRDLWPWPWAHPACRLTCRLSCASLVAIRLFACEKKRFPQKKFTDGQTHGQTTDAARMY